MAEALETFFAAWEVEDRAIRRTLLDEATGARLLYIDPNTPDPITSVAAMNDYLAMFSANMPGGAAAVVSTSTHHGYVRATVAFRKDGATMMHGQYFAELDSFGQVIRLVGFAGMGELE